MRKRLTCELCGGICDSGDLEQGRCFECRASIEQEKLRIARAGEVRRIMVSESYQQKKKDELEKSRLRVPLFNLRAAERGA